MKTSNTDLDQDRFGFGANWSQFLRHLSPEKISQSKIAIQEFTKLKSFNGLTFLDIGSGSGLSSLAARELGAKVHSFDYDPLSVACTRELKERYYEEDQNWSVERGSALDPEYIKSLGSFDIVYSWGVLHHTGEMWKALDLAAGPVKPGGLLYVALYNDQGPLSRVWWHIKRLYNRSNKILQLLMVVVIASILELATAAFRLFTLRNPLPFAKWRRHREERGMSIWHDWVDWIGGFPFEVTTPDRLLHFYQERGFTLKNLRTKGGGWGCCEYLFVRN